MHRSRRIATGTLLASLLVGGLLAPVAHLVWMRWSDASMHQAHQAHRAHRSPATAHEAHQADAHAGHGISNETAGHGVPTTAVSIADPAQDVPTCPYLSLLTSPVPGFTTPTPVVTSAERPVAHVSLDPRAPASPSLAAATARGPPMIRVETA